MAHEIQEHDQMVSGRFITPWHGLGEVKGDVDIFDLHRIMGWKVEKFSLQTVAAVVNGQEILPMDTDAYATVRMPRNTDEKHIVLGAGLKKGYKVLQNEELIEIVQPFVEKGCAIETAGTLKNGQRVWIMLRLAKDLHVGNDDVIQRYIMVSNDHTGSQAARFGCVGIRVVCQNTLNVAESASAANKLIRVMHTGDVNENLKTVASMLDHVNGNFKNYSIDLNALAKKGVSVKDLKRYIENCYFGHWTAEQKKDNGNRIALVDKKVTELFESGAGSDLSSSKGTWYGAYQAVNNHLNHNRDVALDKRLPSLVWGDRAILDKRALRFAMQMAA